MRIGMAEPFGTSAAAPHAAAVAALAREGAPAASAEEINNALRLGARPVGSFPPEAVGAGLIDASATLEQLGVVAANPGAAPDGPPSPGPCKSPRTLPPSEQHSGPVSVIPTSGSETPNHQAALRTFFRLRPRKVVLTRHQRAKVVFRFGSNVSDATFVCRIDGGLFRPCPARLVRRFPLGAHVVSVAARDESGGDRTPARYRFQVKPLH